MNGPGFVFAFARWCFWGMEKYGKHHQWGWDCVGCRYEFLEFNPQVVRIP